MYLLRCFIDYTCNTNMPNYFVVVCPCPQSTHCGGVTAFCFLLCGTAMQMKDPMNKLAANQNALHVTEYREVYILCFAMAKFVTNWGYKVWYG